MKRHLLLPLLLAGALLAGCAQQPESADLLIVNGRIYTFSWDEPASDGTPAPNAPYSQAEGWMPDAQALAIRSGRIVFLGDGGQAESYRGQGTQVIDVQGAAVLPGMVDSHVHIAELGQSLQRVNLVDVQTEEEAVQRVAQRAAQVPEGEWIVGWGWDEGAWANRYPGLELLSEKVPAHPVFLKGLHGFAVWGNRLALERAGISAQTPNPSGGEILKDEQGNPTGILVNRAGSLLEGAMPASSAEQLQHHLLAGLQAMAEAGYVAVHEAGAGADLVEALQGLEAKGELPLPVHVMLSARDTSLLERWRQSGPDAEGPLTIRSVKAFYDGALGSRGARLLEDYSDRPGQRGVSGGEYGFDEEAVAAIMKAGFQVAIHAIGDAGNRSALDFLQAVQQADPSSKALRHRIEHAQVLHPDDIARFAQLEVIASMQPPHAVEDKTWAEERLGPERVRYAYAWRTLRQSGARLAFNSDLPGSDYSIFYGLHAAITRRDKELAPEGGWYPEENMTPEEAIRGYTSWAAFAAFEEGETGSLQTGKRADITVLDIDPMALGKSEPGKILQGKVLLTVAGGKIVFQAAQ